MSQVAKELARNTAHGIVADWLANDDGTPAEQRDRLVAAIENAIRAALAACAREAAKWWVAHTVEYVDKDECVARLVGLERAAEEKTNV